MNSEKRDLISPVELSAGLKDLWLHISMAIEYWIVTRLMTQGIGPVLKRVFQTPIYLYQIGLKGLLGDRILLLTTCGRKTDRLHTIPLEYGYDPRNDAYSVMVGWGWIAKMIGIETL